MSFVQTEFLAFMAIVFVVYWAIPWRAGQNLFLAVASAVFYGWIHPFWLVLMYATALLDFGAALGMERFPHRRGWILTLSLVGNLGLLGYYKYFDFFVVNVDAALGALGIQAGLLPLGLILPAGISFYTFQSMAYTIDVYRGEIAPRRNVVDYLLAVSLFSHLVAGPVQRAGNLLEQAETDRRFDWARVRDGLGLALWGATKKVVVADTISPYVDKVFGLSNPSPLLVWAATLGFTVQILADFSGYTDIARGTARMLGFELMKNFDHPYLAVDPSDFWRRWHISFSTWIRDYLYIPLGGSRGGFWAATRATLIAMALSGLWHGAAWNFVIWGVYHGVLLVLYRLAKPRVPKALRTSLPGHAAAVVAMFGFTVVGWLLFRDPDLARIARVLTSNPLAVGPDDAVAATVVGAVTLAGAAFLIAALWVERVVLPRLSASAWRLPVETTAWAAFALLLFLFVRMTAADFIYFQF